jgi:hypothetical protein
MKKYLKYVLLLLILIPLGYYGYYYYSLKKANQEHFEYWYSEEYIPDSFTGIVTEVNVYDEFYVVVIKVNNQKDRVFNICQKNIVFQKEDSIFKEKSSDKLYKIFTNQKKQIDFSFCKK